ncbi:MAG: DUF4044 domain-containing protein [Bacilli bacterium]|nr:DUF4044 domain-containing protein [Bacilli bacterium]
MNKKTRKIMVWMMLAVMVFSVVAGILIYFL